MFPDSPRLRELVAVAREVTERVVAPLAEAEDAEARWPAPAMRAFAEAGLMGLHAPVAVGGHGQGLAGLVAIAREIARESPSTALCYAMHCVGTAVIAAKATPEQTERYLAPIARGEHITTLALSEPGTGSHFWIPSLAVSREPDGGLLLRGTKSFVTNGGHADSYVMSTSAAPGLTEEEGVFSCVVVDGAAAGLEWQDPWLGLGMRSNSSRTVEVNGVRLRDDQLLGEEGDQLWYVFEVVAPYFLMAMAGTYLGLAESAFDLAQEHLGTRRHADSGELLGHSPILAFELGGLWVELEGARRLIEAAALGGEADGTDGLPGLFAAKVAAANAAVRITNEAMTLSGGMAYRANSKLARLLRDARASHVMSPTTHHLQTWVGRSLLKLPLL
jgi:isovaleryl-CoA dehydrogenase